ncbi:MAG: zinc ribbon domain-containing protein [Eubacteriales bacterium]|nr:zinc ribbon domain-containing protein [Eubacteriales bacterium]
MGSGQGYCITTWRLRLRCKHPQWLRATQELFNGIELFYYNLLLEHEELWAQNSQGTLRGLEILSLSGKEKRVPATPLPWEDVPPYFRRAAANAGIAAAKSHISRGKTSYVNKAEKLNSAVVFYKRMYRDFSAEEITLKVWTGTQWQWMHCRLYGKDFPKDAELMSPSVVFERDFIMLHVPVKEPTRDTSPVKLRMKEGRNICGLQFTNGDAFAVGCVMDKDGKELGVRFFRGGEEYSHYCRSLTEKIDKSREALGDAPKGHPNQKYWMHLKHMSDHYAHQVSREIIRFCQEKDASVIAVPKYNEEYTRKVMIGSGNWGPLHLSMRIREYLSYKAWKAGILVIEVHANGIGSVCALCGGSIADADRKSKEFVCKNGHYGNRYLNAARNLTKKCRTQFEKHVN